MDAHDIKGVILLVFAALILLLSGVASIMAFFHCLRRGSSAGYWEVFMDMSDGKGGVFFLLIGFPFALACYLLLALLLVPWKLLRGESVWPDFGGWKPSFKDIKLNNVILWLAVVPMLLLFVALLVTVVIT